MVHKIFGLHFIISMVHFRHSSNYK